MRKSRLLTVETIILSLCLIIHNCTAFKLPETKSENTALSESIADIFLGDSITGRFGESSGYSGDSASIDTNSDVLLQLIQGHTADSGMETQEVKR